MALFDSLPGYEVEIQDGGIRVTREAAGPKVTLIGATDKTTLALNTPTLLQRYEDIINVDLQSGDPSELSKAASEAFLGGAQNVEVVVTSNNTSLTAVQRFAALSGTYDLLLNTEVDIIVPVGAYIDTNISGNLNFGYQLADFCYQSTVNNNATIGVIGVNAPVAAAATTGDLSLTQVETWVAGLETYDTSGANGAAFALYNGTTDANADGVPDAYGMVATSDRRPASNPLEADVVKDSRGNFVDIGAYLNVVALWGRFGGDIADRLYPVYRYYNNNLAAYYAGMITTFDSWNAPTNQVARGIIPIRDISLSQANRLASKRFVSFITKPRGFVVADAMTGAYNISTTYRSDFTRLTTVRIVHDVLAMIESVGDPFIGKANNAQNRNAMEVAIERGLQKLQSLGALEGFNFSLTSTPAMRTLGEILIDVTLIPAFEIRKIRVKTALSRARA